MSILTAEFDIEAAKRVWREESIEQTKLEVAMRMLSSDEYDLEYVLRIIGITKGDLELLIEGYFSDWDKDKYEALFKKHGLANGKREPFVIRANMVAEKLLRINLTDEQISWVTGLSYEFIEGLRAKLNKDSE